ncbi:membrane protein [Lacticaseibacillus paracasei]|uniref:hypothetical protein n=1 Tax=Lacticaseibacillus paracasei TaxID=1597 RepID=UPI0006822565|nr:hypothetical protein [Lacticaseibacillus paracasei]AKU34019.1 membrane protein [Lacticaseibacillus paracasei]
MRVDTGKYPEGVDPVRVKRLKLLSKVATFTCILMYVSYIPEIIANFSGNPIQPLVAMINATLWTFYGWTKTYKDWPIIISNMPGILFGLVTFITVFIH